MNLYKNINDWLISEYKPLNNWLYFNATPMNIGAVTMNSVPGDRVIKKYVDGTCKCEIIFAIDMITEYDSQGTSDINMNALDEVINFSDWLDTVNINDAPDLGGDKELTKMEVLTNVPSILVDNTNMLAKYQFQCKITYTQLRKEILQK